MLFKTLDQTRNMGVVACKYIPCILTINVEFEYIFEFLWTQGYILNEAPTL